MSRRLFQCLRLIFGILGFVFSIFEFAAVILSLAG